LKAFTTTLFLLGMALIFVSGLLLMTRRQPIKSAWIWYVSAQDGQIYRMWEDGRNPQQITFDEDANFEIAISPDGERLAYVSAESEANDIFVMPIWGDTEQRLTTHPSDELGPTWSSDGESIAFYTGRDGNSEIYTMRADGSEPLRLTHNPGYDGDPMWSPVDTWIVYVANVEGNIDLYRVRATGGIPERITTDSAYDGYPSYSPDGQWLAFTSARNDLGDFHIYTMNVDGSYLTQITTIPVAGGYFDARWSPDGDWITFWGGGTNQYQIFRVRRDGSDFVALTEPGPFLGPVPSRIIGLDWRGGLMFLLGLLMTLPHVYGRV
jgi:TolB protein